MPPVDDAGRVAAASLMTETGEFRLFQAAYHRWYGVDVSETEVEPVFAEYLSTGTVPFWVRDYVREILEDPSLRAREQRHRRTRILVYYVPLFLMFLLIMYFLTRP